MVVISSKEGAYGLERARNHGIDAHLIPRKNFKSSQEWSDAVTACLDGYSIDLICMAGLIHLYSIPSHYEGKVMNIHPALLPAFGGEGMYTERVHKAVIESGVKFSGCTVHFANNEYDRGPIILQRVVPVFDDDNPDTLAARVFEEECKAYPEAVRLFAEGRLRIEGRRVRILPKTTSPTALI